MFNNKMSTISYVYRETSKEALMQLLHCIVDDALNDVIYISGRSPNTPLIVIIITS